MKLTKRRQQVLEAIVQAHKDNGRYRSVSEMELAA